MVLLLKLQLVAGLILLVGCAMSTADGGGDTNPSPGGEAGTPAGDPKDTFAGDPKDTSAGDKTGDPAGDPKDPATGEQKATPPGESNSTPKGLTDPSDKSTDGKPSNKQTVTARAVGGKVKEPKKGIMPALKRSYYSYMCSTLSIFPSSLGKKVPQSLKERMIDVGLPWSCSKFILSSEYGLKNIKELKKKLKKKKIPVVWVVGGPGSGKGTLCKEMVNKEGFTHISVGESLRSEVKKDPNSINARVLQSVMTRGGLIPDIATLNFLSREMLDRIEGSKGFLIDGFPRSLGTAKLFKNKIKPPDVIISVELDDKTMMERLLNRNEGREDDNEKTIKKRLETFHKQQKLVTSYKMFKSKVKEVDGHGTKAEVFERFSEAIHKAIEKKA